MKKIMLGRGEGKTTELIKLSHETNTYILVKDRYRQREVAKIAHELNMDIPYPVTIEDYIGTSGFVGSYIKHILIDDAEDVLQAMFSRVIIDVITMTKGDTN